MKKIILALTALLLVGSAVVKAQDQTRTIDNAKYRITYEAKWVNNTSIKPFIYTDSEMRLDIGEKVTQFYDRTKEIKDSLIQIKRKTMNLDFSDLPKGGRFPFSYYKNYPSIGKSIQLESVGTTDYQCTENVETPDWQLIPDSTADIIGYHCQLAKTQFKGRTWFAWYAEDVPLQEGPWKLIGLPGLILKAYDENKEYTFTAVGMSTLKTPSPITISKSKREEISQKDLRQFKEKFTPGMVLEGIDLKNVKVQDEKGNPVDMKKVLNRKNVFNSIELE